MKTLVGTITENERDEIQQINYRRETLKTIFRSLADETSQFNPVLYDKMMDDMVATRRRYDEWFRDMAKRNDWRGADTMSWSVDFQTCEVFLVDSEVDATPALK